jgi:hypothetical protein
MALRPQTPNGAAPSIRGIRAGEEKGLTPEQNYRVRVMGEEELDLYTRQRRRADYNWPL